MKKYSSDSTNKLLIKYAVKVLISTIISVVLFSLLFSEIVYKLDLELDINNILSIITVFFCSAVISFVSVYSIKNNGALMGIISEIPLILFSLINLIINQNSFIIFAVKLVIIVLTGALFGIIASKKSGKIKV